MTGFATKCWAARCQSQTKRQCARAPPCPEYRQRGADPTLPILEVGSGERSRHVRRGLAVFLTLKVDPINPARTRHRETRAMWTALAEADAPDYRLVSCPCSRDNLDPSCERETEVEVCPALVDGDFGEAV
jgi:hypothetical protein